MATTAAPKSKAVSRTAPEPIDYRRLAERLKQVSELTRLRVLVTLGEGERSVGGLSSEIVCSMSALSRHLAKMRLDGLVVPRRDRQNNVYSLTESGRALLRVIARVVA